MTRQDNILSFMQESKGQFTLLNDERTNYAENIRLLREDVNRILGTGVTPGLTEMVEDLRDRIDKLEEFVTSKSSHPTGFMDVGGLYTSLQRAARSVAEMALSSYAKYIG